MNKEKENGCYSGGSSSSRCEEQGKVGFHLDIICVLCPAVPSPRPGLLPPVPSHIGHRLTNLTLLTGRWTSSWTPAYASSTHQRGSPAPPDPTPVPGLWVSPLLLGMWTPGSPGSMALAPSGFELDGSLETKASRSSDCSESQRELGPTPHGICCTVRERTLGGPSSIF